ncbi:FKBP-type peptidyl-prolyl cis-trans isomerase [Geothermobacter hydrogeniphilus]|uniref:Peptidyl-prolyl cis-trans isomerase n=1 Tax=Geothermobacter hydrogeniphilus TaxID=1969733 RepID=A0A1X0XLB0_9BACT|nr:peptidylprolyl isomerase [Geothermobacter hydrogeniphilus]ORJ53722.1 peptidylprolyl isomerase [Geothermobacter hydrogeniphilus]
MFKAEKGDTVTVNYIGKLADGTLFDSSEGKEPLKFIIGQQEVIAGFDRAVEGMVTGEKKTVTISADDGYGPYHEKLVETVERSLLPDDLDLVVGGQLEVTREDGHVMHFFINDLSDSSVTLDANHPLAGKELTFEISMLNIQKRPAV